MMSFNGDNNNNQVSPTVAEDGQTSKRMANKQKKNGHM